MKACFQLYLGLNRDAVHKIILYVLWAFRGFFIPEDIKKSLSLTFSRKFCLILAKIRLIQIKPVYLTEVS